MKGVQGALLESLVGPIYIDKYVVGDWLNVVDLECAVHSRFIDDAKLLTACKKSLLF